jgi:hypothetical protein
LFYIQGYRVTGLQGLKKIKDKRHKTKMKAQGTELRAQGKSG